MLVTFKDASNVWIDRLLALAHSKAGRHTDEALELAMFVSEEQPTDGADPFALSAPADSAAVAARLQGFSHQVRRQSGGAIAAVDSSVLVLGQLPAGGVVFAIRAAIFCVPFDGAKPVVYSFSTGPLAVDRDNIYPLYHLVGARLGDEEMLVRLVGAPTFYTPKRSVGAAPGQVPDRLRSFVERMVLEEAVAVLEAHGGGYLLIDGCLAAGVFDTPRAYLLQFLAACRGANINVVAISKESRLTIDGVPVTSLLHRLPGFLGYLPLSQLIAAEQRNLRLAATGESGKAVEWATHEISLADDVFVVRFGRVPGIAFRVDVHPIAGMRAAEVLDAVHFYCRITSGYPGALVSAHQFCGFLLSDAQALLARATVEYGVRPQRPASLEPLFSPFASARFK